MFGLFSRWIPRLLGGAALGAVVLGATGCSREEPAETPSYDEMKTALDGVATAAGTSALDRMAACDLQIDWADSSLLLIPMEAKSVDMQPGDKILAIDFSAPNRPGQTAGRTQAEALWLFRDGAVTPHNGWATTIQQAKPPMGSAFYLNC